MATGGLMRVGFSQLSLPVSAPSKWDTCGLPDLDDDTVDWLKRSVFII